MEHFTRKRGVNRGQPRLWIEGKHLVQAGFKPGDRYDIAELPNGFTIRKNDEGKRKISGKGEKPIIDIVGGALGKVKEAQTVDCAYAKGRGLIRVEVAS